MRKNTFKDGFVNKLSIVDKEGFSCVKKEYTSEIRFNIELSVLKIDDLPAPRLIDCDIDNSWIMYEYIDDYSLAELVRDGKELNYASIARDLIKTHSIEQSQSTLADYYASLKPIKELPKELSVPEPDLVREQFYYLKDDLIETAKTYHEPINVCMVHGDFHYKNIMANKDGESLGFIDWEASHIGSLFYDFAVLTVTNPDVNHPIIEEYLDQSGLEFNHKIYDFCLKFVLLKTLGNILQKPARKGSSKENLVNGCLNTLSHIIHSVER